VSDHLKWVEVCEPERSVNLDASRACTPLRTALASPIDNFYSYLATLIPLGTEEQLRTNDALGKALLLGVVSAVEHYFRAVLSGLTYLCPLVRQKASSLVVPFGAMEYYSREDIGLALFENSSLADSIEVLKFTQKLLGIQVQQNSSISAALAEYDKLCQLRHAAVHSRGDLAHKNLQSLGIKSTTGRLAIRVELSTLHSSAAVCQNVVRAYNRLIYKKTLEAWIGNRVLSGNWKQDKARFAPIFNLFHSQQDGQGYANAYLAYRGFLPLLTSALTTVDRGEAVRV
jgi:hypothetical protein